MTEYLEDGSVIEGDPDDIVNPILTRREVGSLLGGSSKNQRASINVDKLLDFRILRDTDRSSIQSLCALPRISSVSTPLGDVHPFYPLVDDLLDRGITMDSDPGDLIAAVSRDFTHYVTRRKPDSNLMQSPLVMVVVKPLVFMVARPSGRGLRPVPLAGVGEAMEHGHPLVHLSERLLMRRVAAANPDMLRRARQEVD